MQKATLLFMKNRKLRAICLDDIIRFLHDGLANHLAQVRSLRTFFLGTINTNATSKYSRSTELELMKVHANLIFDFTDNEHQESNRTVIKIHNNNNNHLI